MPPDSRYPLQDNFWVCILAKLGSFWFAGSLSASGRLPSQNNQKNKKESRDKSRETYGQKKKREHTEIQKSSKEYYYSSIPISMMRELGWKEGQKIEFSLRRGYLVIKDWQR